MTQERKRESTETRGQFYFICGSLHSLDETGRKGCKQVVLRVWHGGSEAQSCLIGEERMLLIGRFVMEEIETVCVCVCFCSAILQYKLAGQESGGSRLGYKHTQYMLSIEKYYPIRCST